MYIFTLHTIKKKNKKNSSSGSGCTLAPPASSVVSVFTPGAKLRPHWLHPHLCCVELLLLSVHINELTAPPYV